MSHTHIPLQEVCWGSTGKKCWIVAMVPTKDSASMWPPLSQGHICSKFLQTEELQSVKMVSVSGQPLAQTGDCRTTRSPKIGFDYGRIFPQRCFTFKIEFPTQWNLALNRSKLIHQTEDSPESGWNTRGESLRDKKHQDSKNLLYMFRAEKRSTNKTKKSINVLPSSYAPEAPTL